MLTEMIALDAVKVGTGFQLSRNVMGRCTTALKKYINKLKSLYLYIK